MVKKKQDRVTESITVKGELVGFNAIVQPSTMFNKEGVYNANILLSTDEGKKLADKLKEVRTSQFKTYGKGSKVAEITGCKPYEKVDDETGEAILDDENRYIFKAKAKAYVENGKPKIKIPIYDSKLNPAQAAKIGEGSIVRLSVELVGYTVAGKTGVSVKLKGVQIINLVEYTGSQSAESLGFAEEDDGYIVSDEDDIEETSDSTEEDDEEEDF